MMMGTESFPEMSGNFHTLVRPSDREHIIEFGRRESFKDCLSCLSAESCFFTQI